MFLAYLTLFTALAISGVAIFYSVAGLAAIFAAAVIPIIIMGGILESAKLVTAVWLHRYWHRCVWWLKAYLSVAVLVLMLITSMGIFGFLSRAHIEQTSLSTEQMAQASELSDQIDRLEGRVSRWNEELDRLFSGADVRVDSLLSREQEELNNIYARIEREKSQLRQDAQSSINVQNDRLAQAQARRDQNIQNARIQFADDSEALSQAIERASSAEVSVASAVQREIVSINRSLSEQLDAVDERFESQVASVQERINQLRSQSTSRTDDIDQRIIQLEDQIREEQLIIADLRQQRSAAEREFRMLEAEVGPIKYIAEFIYREKADKDLLEEAVRWVIIIIIFVFDPLAVLLLIASQFTFQYIREDKIARGEMVKSSKIDELFGLVEPNGSLKTESNIPKTSEPEQEVSFERVAFEENIEEDMAPVFVSVQPKDVESPEEFVSRVLKEHPDPNNWHYNNDRKKLSSNEGLIAYNITKEDAVNITRLAASILSSETDGKYLGKVGDRKLILRKPKK